VYSLGGISLAPNAKGAISIAPSSPLNEFGKKLGYKGGDEVYAFNGVTVNPNNLNEVVTDIKAKMREGQPFTAKVGRKNESGGIDTVTLSTTVSQVTELDINKLELMPQPTSSQLAVQKAWLTTQAQASGVPAATANPADVASIDAVIKTLYDVISGPAGNRDWNRFYSLYLPDARMGAAVKTPGGDAFRSFTPAEYQKMNAPQFAQSGFFEEELNRKVMQYGNVAAVQSAYQFRFQPNGPVEQRGVNYITLVKSEGRWWVANISWQGETKDLPLPVELQKK
jgi:hypothetical protein